MSAKRNRSSAFRFFFTARPAYWVGAAVVGGICITIFAASGLAAARATPDKWQRSVVLVEADIQPEVLPGMKIDMKQFGTGFALNGRIYTCEHVIHQVQNLEVTLHGGSKQKARLLRSSERTDLAELAIPHPPRSLKLRASPPLFFERVWQIGNPGPLRWVVTTGMFLSFTGSDNCFLIDTWFGNSGSPILDSRGDVIGMTHAIVQGTRFTLGGTLEDLRNFIYPDRPR